MAITSNRMAQSFIGISTHSLPLADSVDFGRVQAKLFWLTKCPRNAACILVAAMSIGLLGLC
uniref:Uncharacterized protein n=1 Tax=Meloidogyne incognita TaxID=6306 RepID=A0A914MEH8_MELIC